jgi:hypothetical protein
MGIYQSAARLSMRDVNDLNQASEHLAALAEMIRRINPGWCEGAVNLIISVNNTVVRLQRKGAAAYSRYLERHDVKGAVVDPKNAGTIDNLPDDDDSKPKGS